MLLGVNDFLQFCNSALDVIYGHIYAHMTHDLQTYEF